MLRIGDYNASVAVRNGDGYPLLLSKPMGDNLGVFVMCVHFHYLLRVLQVSFFFVIMLFSLSIDKDVVRRGRGMHSAAVCMCLSIMSMASNNIRLLPDLFPCSCTSLTDCVGIPQPLPRDYLRKIRPEASSI
jgi:hypothetical protein